MHADVAGLEEDLSAGGETRVGQIFDHFVLAIDCNRAAAREPAQIDSMAPAREAQFDSMVNEALTLQSIADAHFSQQIDSSLFEDAGADSFFDVFSAARLDDDRLDTPQVQQM